MLPEVDHGKNRQLHERFLVFLERFAKGEAARELWEALVVAHYEDPKLEEVRQACVRLRMQNEAMNWSMEERDQLELALRALRTE